MLRMGFHPSFFSCQSYRPHVAGLGVPVNLEISAGQRRFALKSGLLPGFIRLSHKPMKTTAVLLMMCCVPAVPGRAADLAAGAGEVFVNGGFEAFTGGVPDGWTYQRGDGPATLESATFISPFASPLGGSTRSVLLTDGTGNLPQLSQHFASWSGAFRMEFDFRLNGPLTGAGWSVRPTAPDGGPLFKLGLDQGGSFSITSGLDFFTVSGLLPSTWYHVELDGSTASGRYGGSITPDGGAPTFWTDFSFAGNSAALAGIVIGDDAAGVANAALVLDNFFIVPVPEPGLPLWCAAVAGTVLLIRRLRSLRRR